MCDICKAAKKFKDPIQALDYIGKRIDGALPECLDSLIGDLLGEKLSAVDKKAEGDWERANKG